jgi:GH15 family glucan-1,4-alpha-glucosidase
MLTTKQEACMARPIVLSNGGLHVGINKYGLVHDFYYPYVGLENHVAGKSLRHKVGIWIDGELSWLDDDYDWQFTFRYPSHALIGHTLAKNERLGVLLEFDDVVDAELDVFLRNIHVVNLWNNEREIRLFTHQVFAIGDSRSNTDTAQYLPQSGAVLHYRGRRAFIISGIHCDSGEKFDQYTVGLFGIEGHEGSYRDADDGELSFGNVEHGRVDSVLRFRLVIPAHSSARVHYWITAGRSMKEAMVVHKQIQHDGLSKRLHTTADWWHKWLKPAIKVAGKIDPDHQDNFLRSMMIIKSQIDKRGAVIASTDTTMLNYSRDAYAYCWPRDGALTLWPLIRIGYQEEPRRFFEFCRRGLHEDGYLMHKYQADGAIGSSWHPYLHDGMYARPIQEDETASVLFMFSQFYHAHPTKELLDDFYSTLVVPMANFMAQFIDPVTGLPSPSYDLWEEVLLTTTYTTAVTYAALEAAAELAEKVGDAENVVKWRSAADEIYQAAHKHLYNPNRKAFYKGVIVKDGDIVKDETVDMSSFFGAFIFGLFATDSPEVKATHQTITEVFGHDGMVTGVPRYENDNYQRSDPNIPPNWWFITSLWLAQYASELEQPEEAKRILDWVKDHASSTAVLSEQLHPHSEVRTSVEPLTWSHAEYISALLDNITDEHAS